MALLKRPFRDWPIDRKLLTVVLATTTLALGVAGVGVGLWDLLLFRGYLDRDLTALSEIIAENSSGAIAFDDAKTAADTLNALRARPHVVTACTFRQDGSVLARYARDGNDVGCTPPSRSNGVVFREDAIEVTRSVMLAGRPIGRVTLLYDLGELTQRRNVFGAAVLCILILSSIVAGVLSARLRELLTDPIARLARTASAVSATRDYSIRAEKVTGDELGVLVDSFNEMLARIASRDEELRRALAEREEANRRLERTNEDLERFAFIASHDLQEPLRMITVYTQLLQKRALLDASPQTAEFVDNIVGGARRMRELLSDLLAYAELGAEHERDTIVNLNSVLAKVRENLSITIRDNNAVITGPPLPSLRAYEGHLVPVLQNLIGNAIKYRGQEAPHIEIAYQNHGGELRFSFSDNGVGIAEQYHNKIFVPFKRLHGSEIPGSGIGLAICKRVIERYGGRIWVESKPGQGSKFLFTLPGDLLVNEAQAPGKSA